jgi:hypothetical protein
MLRFYLKSTSQEFYIPELYDLANGQIHLPLADVHLIKLKTQEKHTISKIYETPNRKIAHNIKSAL